MTSHDVGLALILLNVGHYILNAGHSLLYLFGDDKWQSYVEKGAPILSPGLCRNLSVHVRIIFITNYI